MKINGQGLPAVDVHTHLAPKFSRDYLPDSGFKVGERGQAVINGDEVGPSDLYQPEELLKYLDEQNLDQALVSVPPPFFRQGMSSVYQAAWVTAVNEGIFAACAVSERLKPLLYLPLDAPALAIEMLRIFKVRQAVSGWTGAAGGGSIPLDDAAFLELWQMLSADGRPLVLHPGSSLDGRLQAHYLHNLLGNPIETGVAVAQLIFGGVLEDHPKLKILLVHCGGVVPSVAGRWQRGIDTARPGVKRQLSPVMETLKRVYVDCLTHDSANVDLARHVFGDSQLLLGSDWPFPMGLEDPRLSTAHLDGHLQDAIARNNPHMLARGEQTSSWDQGGLVTSKIINTPN